MSNLSHLDNINDIEMAMVKNPIMNKDSSNTIPNHHHEPHHHTTNAPPPRRRRRVSLARAFVGNKVNSIGMKLRRFKENHPGIVSIILTVHAIGKLLIFFVDIISDTTLVFEISNNDAVQDYFYMMLFFLLLQYLFGMIGLNVYFKKDLYQNPPARLKVGDKVEARKPHWGYDRHQPGNIIKINVDDNTYDIEFYAWSYEKRDSVVEDRIITRVKQLEIKDYDQLPKTFYTNKDLNIIRMNNFKRFIGFLLSPILVIVFDVLMLIYRPLEKYLNPEIIPFIIQYDAQRTLVEVCVESVPQSIIQLFLYFRCLNGACGFQDQRAFLSTQNIVTISLIVSFISILRLIITVYITTQAMGITLKQYIHHLLELGSGLNLDAINANSVKTLRFFNLSKVEINQLVPVLKNNTSAEEFYIDWENMTDMEVHLFVNETKHDAVIQSYINNIPVQYTKGTPFIIACEKGLLEIVRYFIEHFKEDASSFKNVTEFINQRGEAVGGYFGYTGLIIAAKMEQFHVVKYLLQMDGIDLSIVREGDTSNNDGRVRGRNAIHYAAYYNTKNAETLKILLNHKKCTSDIVNGRNVDGSTPLDFAHVNSSEAKNQIIKLLSSNGGKRQKEL